MRLPDDMQAALDARLALEAEEERRGEELRVERMLATGEPMREHYRDRRSYRAAVAKWRRGRGS